MAIGEMGFFDLVLIPPKGEDDRQLNWNGVYVFIGKDDEDTEEEVKYVGRAKSRTFLERMGGHFDLRDIGGQNNFLKTIAEKTITNQKGKIVTTSEIIQAARLGSDHHYRLVSKCIKKWGRKIMGIKGGISLSATY